MYEVKEVLSNSAREILTGVLAVVPAVVLAEEEALLEKLPELPELDDELPLAASPLGSA